MNRYAKLSAALLAGMLVSGGAMAEEHKYFECKVTRKFNSNYPACTPTCGGSNEKACDEIFKQDFSRFKKEGDEYYFTEAFQPTGGFQSFSISRTTGEFSWHCQSCGFCENVGNPLVWQAEGSCRLKTDKLKF